MITCDECGRENDDEYKFCLGCGASLEDSGEPEEDDDGADMVNCPFCGAEQPANFKFCGSCGEQIPDSVAEDDGESTEPAGDRSTAPGKPGVEGPSAEESSPGVSQPGQGPTDPAAGSGSAGLAEDATEAGQSTPGTAAAGEYDNPPPMPSDVPGDSDAGQQPAGGVQTVARLVVIRPDGTEGATIDVPKDKLTLGRANELDALSGDPFLSPQHASVLYENGKFVVRDEESLNGIFREVVDSTELQDGDFIRVGQELLEFELFDESAEAEDEEPPLPAGSPGAEDYWGRLRLVAGPEVYTEAYALDEPEVTLGRETGDIVFKDDGFVSGTHAQVAWNDGTPELRDLNSSNGTFLRIRGEHSLQNGERVLMGQQLFRLEVD